MSNNPLESPIRKISAVSDFAKEIELGSSYLLKPQIYLNKLIESPQAEKLILAKDFLRTILKPTIIQLRYRDAQTPTGIKSPRTEDIQIKLNNIYYIDGKLRLLGFLIFQTLMRLNLKFEEIESLIPLAYRHWVFLNCWELSECQDLPTELFTQTDPYTYFIHTDEIPSHNLPRTWFNRFAIRVYFLNNNPNEFSSRLYGNVVHLISEANTNVINMKDPEKFEQTEDHQVDWLNFGIDLVKALLTHNEISQCSRVGPHLEDLVIEHKLQDKIRWKELSTINETVDKLLNQNCQFNWKNDIMVLKSDQSFINLGLLEKLEYLLEKKVIPSVLFSEIILEGMSLDSSKVEIFDLSIILHVYYKLTQADLTEDNWYYNLDSTLLAKLYDYMSKLDIRPSEFLLPSITFLKDNLTISSLKDVKLLDLDLIDLKFSKLDYHLKRTHLPDLVEVKNIQSTILNNELEVGSSIARAFKFLEDTSSNAEYLKHIDQKYKIPFLFECGKEAYLSERYYESSFIFEKLVEYIEHTQSEENNQVIFKSSKKHARLSWIRYCLRIKLNPEELPKFVTEPALLLCVQTSEKGTNVNVANAELKWSDEELFELGQFYCLLNDWKAAEQLFAIITKYTKAKPEKSTTHNFLNVAPSQLDQFFNIMSHGVKIFNLFLETFNNDPSTNICEKLSYKEAQRILENPKNFMEMRNSLVKIINIFKTSKKVNSQTEQKTLLSFFFKDIYSTPFPWFFINLITGYLIYKTEFLTHKPIKEFGFGSILACPFPYPQIESLHNDKVVEFLKNQNPTTIPGANDTEIDFWVPTWQQLIIPILRFGEDNEIPKFIQLQLSNWIINPPLDLPVDEFFVEWFLSINEYSNKDSRVCFREKIAQIVPIYTKVIERSVPKLGKIAIAIMSQFILPHRPYNLIFKFVDQARVNNEDISLIWLLFDYETTRLLCERFRPLDTPTYEKLFKKLNSLEATPIQSTPNEKDPKRYEIWKDAYEFHFREFWRCLDVEVYYYDD